MHFIKAILFLVVLFSGGLRVHAQTKNVTKTIKRKNATPLTNELSRFDSRRGLPCFIGCTPKSLQKHIASHVLPLKYWDSVEMSRTGGQEFLTYYPRSGGTIVHPIEGKVIHGSDTIRASLFKSKEPWIHYVGSRKTKEGGVDAYLALLNQWHELKGGAADEVLSQADLTPHDKVIPIAGGKIIVVPKSKRDPNSLPSNVDFFHIQGKNGHSKVSKIDSSIDRIIRQSLHPNGYVQIYELYGPEYPYLEDKGLQRLQDAK